MLIRSLRNWYWIMTWGRPITLVLSWRNDKEVAGTQRERVQKTLFFSKSFRNNLQKPLYEWRDEGETHKVAYSVFAFCKYFIIDPLYCVRFKFCSLTHTCRDTSQHCNQMSFNERPANSMIWKWDPLETRQLARSFQGSPFYVFYIRQNTTDVFY
jgi:hypothetical protein